MTELQSYSIQFFEALLFNFLIESVLLWLLMRPTTKTVLCGRFFGAVFLANVGSLPYVWFVVKFGIPHASALPISEILVVLYEALCFRLCLCLETRQCLIFSAATNIFSFCLGYFLRSMSLLPVLQT